MDHVLDIYDDPTASVLVRRIGAGTELPAKLAGAQMLEEHELRNLPDRLFALVATEHGAPLRKYAMHDEPHLALSIAYFLECGHALPQPAQVKVASNLVNACAWYDGVEPPASLVKIALMGFLNAGLTAAAVPGAVQKARSGNQANMDALRAAQASGMKTAAKRSIELTDEQQRRLSEGGSGDPAGIDFIEQALGDFGGSPEQQYAKFKSTGDNPFAKIANLTGTELGAQGALSADPRSTAMKRIGGLNKAAHQHAGDLTGHKHRAVKVASAEHYALGHRKLYPIDDVAQVKIASSYFDEYCRELSLEDRRIFAQSVAIRAEELGVKVAGRLLDYAGDDYGPHIRGELQRRISAFEGTEKAAGYEVLLEQLDTTPPAVMADVLKMADAEAGVSSSYGRAVTGFRDPFSAVYGKTASVEDDCLFSWAENGHYVSGEQLGTHAKHCGDVDHIFGNGFSMQYRRDPVGTFRSLPDPQKVVLSRLANSEAARTP